MMEKTIPESCNKWALLVNNLKQAGKHCYKQTSTFRYQKIQIIGILSFIIVFLVDLLEYCSIYVWTL